MAKLGQAWMVWGPRNDVKRRCKISGKVGWWECELCKRQTERIEIDHVKPVVSTTDGFVDWNTYIASKFVGAEFLQGICRDCHKAKSKEENKIRREVKRKN